MDFNFYKYYRLFHRVYTNVHSHCVVEEPQFYLLKYSVLTSKLGITNLKNKKNRILA